MVLLKCLLKSFPPRILDLSNPFAQFYQRLRIPRSLLETVIYQVCVFDSFVEIFCDCNYIISGWLFFKYL